VGSEEGGDSMKDCKGNVVLLGNRVRVMPRDGMEGGIGYVRRIKSDSGERCRVDDGPENMTVDLPNADKRLWTWSAWCKSSEIERL
jgi:hypothetical protein